MHVFYERLRPWELYDAEFAPEGFEQVEREPPGRQPHAGGRPPKPVMPIEAARQLQGVIDTALANGQPLVIARLAERFDITRQRIRQAIELRRRGHDLTEIPAEFRTVSDSDQMAYWPTLGSPRKT